MNRRQFLRLTLVLALPLMILGVVLALTLYPRELRYNVLCMDQHSREFCHWVSDTPRSSGGSTIFGFHHPSFHGAVIDVGVYADGPRLVGAVVEEAVAEASFDLDVEYEEMVERVQGIVGRRAIIALGASLDRWHFDTSNNLGFVCGNLSFYDNPLFGVEGPNRVSAWCGGPEWRARITFSPDDAGRAMLSRLRTSAIEMAQDLRFEFWAHYVISALLPVALFLLASLVIWLFLRAVSYVRAG